MTLSPDFSPLSATAGGVLIGLAATLLFAANGRIAGISGIVAGVLDKPSSDRAWQYAFAAAFVAVALLAGPWLRSASHPSTAPALLIAGGLLVGFGTRLANGCTSGHGVCGLARGAKRSMVASLSFVGAGMATVFIVRHVLGGAP